MHLSAQVDLCKCNSMLLCLSRAFWILILSYLLSWCIIHDWVQSTSSYEQQLYRGLTTKYDTFKSNKTISKNKKTISPSGSIFYCSFLCVSQVCAISELILGELVVKSPYEVIILYLESTPRPISDPRPARAARAAQPTTTTTTNNDNNNLLLLLLLLPKTLPKAWPSHGRPSPLPRAAKMTKTRRFMSGFRYHFNNLRFDISHMRFVVQLKVTH